MIDRILNLIIFLTVVYSVGSLFRQNGKWSWAYGWPLFRYFTVLSNTFCGLAALYLAFCPDSLTAWAAKYIGTVALTVTMLTVFLFLAPTMGSLKDLLKNEQLYMHLITPLLAIISYVLLERRELSFLQALMAEVPVLLYGILYCYKVVFKKKWDDFYGFNHGGRWYLYLPAMLTATFILCMIYKLIS